MPIVKLEGLDDDAIEYAKKLKESNARYSSVSDSDLLKICNGVGGHPLAIEFAMWLMGYGKTADDIMQHMPEYSGIGKVEEFSKRLFLDIFNDPTTSDEERECFLKCSVFRERIKEEEIKFLYDGRDVFILLAGLIDKLLITYKEGFYEIHPLVRSFSYEKLADKKSVHKKAADYLMNLRAHTLNVLLEEKIFYHLSEAKEWGIIADSIEGIGRKFIQQGQLGLINEFMHRLVSSNISRPIFDIFYGDIAQIKGEWDKAINYFDNASRNTQDNKIKVEGIVKYGEILFRRGDIKESLPFFENAYEFAKKQSYASEEARALNDMGLVFENFDELESSYEKHSASLKIRKEIGDIEGIATSYNNMGNVFNKQMRYSKALEYYGISEKIAKEIGNKKELALYLNNIGEVLRLQEKFDEALVKINEALRINEEIGDKAGIGSSLNSIGLIYLKQRKLNESINKLRESLTVTEEIGDKRGMANSYNNIGSYYLEIENYASSLSYFFKALDLNIKMGNRTNEKNVLDWIHLISTKTGKEEFKYLSNKVFNELDFGIRKNINLNVLCDEPNIKNFTKVGRNDPCPCGSGKKYKQCHGKSL